MKKIVLLPLLFALISFSVFAQGFYFDIGLGGGKAWTKIDGEEINPNSDPTEFAVDFGLKAGYGPFGQIPLYVVAEYTEMGHAFIADKNIAQLASSMLGAGVVYYPLRMLQLGAGAGYSFTGNLDKKDILGFKTYDSKGGFAWNATAALDLGKKNHGFLIGLKYFMSFNTLEVLDVKQNQSYLGIFVKYAYRNKPFND